MKRKKTLLEIQRKELRYWQMMVRMDITAYKQSKKKCKEVAAEMRKIQKMEIK